MTPEMTKKEARNILIGGCIGFSLPFSIYWAFGGDFSRGWSFGLTFVIALLMFLAFIHFEGCKSEDPEEYEEGEGEGL